MRQHAVGNFRSLLRALALLCFTGHLAALDVPEICPLRIAGYNYQSSLGNYSYSPFLPTLPDGTIISNYGPAALCGFNGTIVVGGPLSLAPGTRWYGYSAMIRQSLSIFLDWLNGQRGGVKIGDARYAMRFVWVDDASKSSQVGPATAHATRKTNADFAFGGYSSGLTAHAARQSFGDGYLMMSGGAASTSVFTQNNLTFGLFPPASTYHERPLEAVKKAAELVDETGRTANNRTYTAASGLGPCYTGEGGCSASLKVGFVQAAASFTRAQCANGPTLARQLNMTLAEHPNDANNADGAILASLPKEPTLAQAEAAVNMMREAGANVIIGCFYVQTSRAFIEAMEKLDFTPLALSISASHAASWKTDIDGGWWQGEYAIGPTPWQRTLPTVGQVTGMTSTDFFDTYKARYGNQEVSYHGAAPFAAAVALVKAIENAGSLDATLVSKKLEELDVVEFYGRLQFDENHQYAGGMVVVQYAPGSRVEEVAWPETSATVPASHLGGSFPWAPWRQRRCAVHGPGSTYDDYQGSWRPPSLARVTQECSGHGLCGVDGLCVCIPGYRGASCQTKEQSCDPGYVEEGDACLACPAGTFEKRNKICQDISSSFFINKTAAVESDRLPCPPNMQFNEIIAESQCIDNKCFDMSVLNIKQGARNASDCVCQAGFYMPASLVYLEANLENYDAAAAQQTSSCLPCPQGAECIGNLAPPIARPGYAMSTKVVPLSGSDTGIEPCFEACVNGDQCTALDRKQLHSALALFESCLDVVDYDSCIAEAARVHQAKIATATGSCDCLGGFPRIGHDNQTSRSIPALCGVGYLQNSQMCAECDTQCKGGQCKQARRQGACRECTYSESLSFIGPLLIILLIFPMIEVCITNAESLEITLNFVQTVGLISGFAIPFNDATTEFLSFFAIFNVDIDVLHMACANMEYRDIWLMQAVVIPLFYLVFCVVHVCMSRLLLSVVRQGIPGAETLLNIGWRPRRSFSFSSILDTHLPGIVFYLNMYYITGISKAFEPFACSQTESGSYYLRAAPSIKCWEGEHLTILALDIIPLLIYFIGVPVVYSMILFYLIPKKGFNNARLNGTFGFIWSRFEERCYWWEAVEFTGRKFPLVMITLFANGVIFKCVLGALVVGLVMAANFAWAPYVKRTYDILDQIVSLTECMIFLMGMLAMYRQQTRELKAMGLNVDEYDTHERIETLIVFMVVITLCCLAAGAVWDFVGLYHARNDRIMRKSKGIGEPKLLNMQARGSLMLEWLKQANAADLASFHKVQLMLNRAHARIENEDAIDAKLAAYSTQIQGMPELMDRVLTSREGDIFLSHFVNDIASNPERGDGVAASELIADSFSSSVLMWLNDVADPKEKAVFANFVAALKKFSLAQKRKESVGERFTNCWEKTFAATDRVKAIQLKIENDIKAARTKQEQPSESQTDSHMDGKDGKNGEATSSTSDVPASTQEGADEALRARSKGSLGALLSKTATSLQQSKEELLRRNAVERLLKELLDEANCEAVVLVPIEKMADGQEVPRLVFASERYGDNPEKDSARVDEATGWDCKEGTPAGLSKSLRATVNVTNLIADSRFPDLNYKTLGAKAICQISQLVIPVFEGGGANSDAEDDSIGSTLIAVIKLVNKVSLGGEKSGLTFQMKDEILGRVFSGLLLETLMTKHGANKDETGFMSKLQAAMNRQKARKILSNADAENKAATVMQSTYRGHRLRGGSSPLRGGSSPAKEKEVEVSAVQLGV